MNEWLIAITGGLIGSIVVLLSPQRSILLKQILIIGVVGYISLALLMLHYGTNVGLLFLMIGVVGIIGKKIFEELRVSLPISMEGGEKL